MRKLRLVTAQDAGLVSVTQAAALLPVSTATIRRRLRDGKWPGGKSGGKYALPGSFVTGLAASWAGGSGVVAEEFAKQWMRRQVA